MDRRTFHICLAGIVLVTVLGAPLDVMEVDAAQYASMSRDMLATDDWTQLYHRGRDYLDKPPLLFWISALSFKLLGVSNWSYKLPSILFAFLGILSVHRFTALYVPVAVARTASLMFGGCAAFLLMTNDVRCDTILTASVITAIWLAMAWLEQRRWWQLIGAVLAMAAGMLAKGPMGIMAPALAVGGHVIVTRRWRALADARLLLVPVLLAVLLLPMCIGLYEQHGMHGLRFYFWEQSFGRITGENRWKDDSSLFFFTHEVIWQVLPWTVFVLLGTCREGMALVRRVPLPEAASITGALLVFVALSFSRFKLPHYLYVAVPLFCVMGARAWHAEERRWPVVVHLFVPLLLWVAALVLVCWSFPEGAGPFAALLGVMGIIAVMRLRRVGLHRTTFPITFWTICAIGIALNGHIYPQLLSYQANAVAGRWAAAQGFDKDHFFGLQQSGTALDFYFGGPVPWLSNVDEARPVVAAGVVIYTDAPHRRMLEEAGLVPQRVIGLKNYTVQLLGMEVLHPQLRKTVLEDRYLLIY